MSLKKAALISIFSKYLTVFGTLIFTAVLSRILTPEDYGITAVVGVFTTFFSLLSDLGIGNGIIQNKSLTNEDINDIFSFTAFLGVILAIFFAGCAYPFSIIYKDACYLTICPILSISIFANTINTVPKSLILKQKRFFLAGFRNIVTTIVSMAIAVVMAQKGLKYYALVFQSVFSSMMETAWNLSTVSVRFTFRCKFNSIRKIKDFSKFIVGYNFVNYYVRNLDSLLIGAFMGNTVLGYYDKSYKLMGYPMQYLTHSITPVFQPIFSEYQTDISYIYRTYLKVVRILSIIGVYVACVFFFAAEEIILLFFGSQWVLSIPCFKILSLSVWPQIIYASTGTMFISLNDSGMLFRVGCYETLLMIFFILIGVLSGRLEVVCVLVCIGLILRFFLNYYFLIKKLMNQSFYEFLKSFYKELIIAGIMYGTVFLGASFFDGRNMMESLFWKLVLCSTGYVIGLLVTKEYQEIFSYLKIRKFRGKL